MSWWKWYVPSFSLPRLIFTHSRIPFHQLKESLEEEVYDEDEGENEEGDEEYDEAEQEEDEEDAQNQVG